MSTDNGVDAHRPILCMPIRNNKFEIIGKLWNNISKLGLTIMYFSLRDQPQNTEPIDMTGQAQQCTVLLFFFYSLPPIPVQIYNVEVQCKFLLSADDLREPGNNVGIPHYYDQIPVSFW